jgi:tetratricopeptide (TPR) repeat protein
VLGESGTSKSTVLMEIMCDYFRDGYRVLHNIGSTQLAQANDIVQYIESMVKGNNKLLIAIDNAHDKKMSAIFYVIDQLSFIDSSKDLLFIVTARLPEYDTLVSKRLLELDDQDRIALKKFSETQGIEYRVPYFKNAEEVEQFFTFYKTKYNIDKSTLKSYLDIFNETGGQPIMIKFFLLGKSLREDVEHKYKLYLFDSETKKPKGENIQTMLICALFSISNSIITDQILDDMKVRKYARSIRGILHRRKGTWTTIHSRWDMELFSYLFSGEDEDEIDDRKTQLSDACASIFDMRNEQFSLSVISALYDMAGENQIPINIVNDNVRIPEYIANDKGAMYRIHAYYKSGAYYDLKMYDETLFECDEAIKINENRVDALGNKGLALDSLGKYEEAIVWYDKALIFVYHLLHQT